MSETEHEQEPEVPGVADVPEPDQEPTEDQAEEEAEAEQAESHEPESEPEARGANQEEWEARFKGAERAFKTYTDKITKLWAEDALSLVPFNLDPAAPSGFIDTRNKGHVEDETKAAALAFLGFDGETDMESDPYSDLCTTCKGHGLVLTGSKVVNQDTRRCLDCNGIGYIPKEGPVQAASTNGVKAETHDSGQLVPNAVGVESPEVQSLRMQGYTIIPPMQTST